VLAIVLETVLVLLPLGFHAVVGLLIAAREGRDPAPRAYGTVGLAITQRLTGVIILCFLVFHLAHTWFDKLSGAHAGSLYDTLWAEAGTPLYLFVYVVGLTALSVHLAQGLFSFVVTWGVATTAKGQRTARVVTAVFGLLVWIVALNTVSHFAVGRALLWGGAESTAPAPMPQQP
jgi:succinate dehydrogenase / fumarate reductase cytochrome b subunit